MDSVPAQSIDIILIYRYDINGVRQHNCFYYTR